MLRQISVNLELCRLLETTMMSKIVDNLKRYNLLNKSQHGFLESKSCFKNLFEFLEDISKMIEEEYRVNIV